jgi:hypothetical protein
MNGNCHRLNIACGQAGGEQFLAAVIIQLYRLLAATWFSRVTRDTTALFDKTTSSLCRPDWKHRRLADVLREFLTSRNLRCEHWQGGTKRRVMLLA